MNEDPWKSFKHNNALLEKKLSRNQFSYWTNGKQGSKDITKRSKNKKQEPVLATLSSPKQR